MPHLTVEYSNNLEIDVDISAFCLVMRDAMVETGIFPLGGIRVRAFPARAYVIADNDPDYAYLHLICRAGHGRPEEVRVAAAETIYAAAEAYLKPRVSGGFALSLDFDELSPTTSIKRFNTIHDDLKKKAHA